MGMVRSLAGVACLCLFLAASTVSAAEPPAAPARQEVSTLARLFGQLETFLRAVWESDAGYIDPWGGVSLTIGTPEGNSAGAGPDDAGYIDPFGGR